jgi:alcohol dehydrogenase YqhD (iron-dependent ADH family)
MKTAVFRVLSNPEDYRYRAQIMWGGTLARNALRKVFCHAGFGLRQNLRNFASYQ